MMGQSDMRDDILQGPAQEHSMLVVKRDGRLVEFDAAKIEGAVMACLQEDGDPTQDAAARTLSVVDVAILALPTHEDRVSIETIQQAVIDALIETGDPKAAVRYAEYKARHDAARGRDIPEGVRAAFESNATWFPTQLQQFQVLDKYARWNAAEGRREIWEESIDRVMGQLDTIVGQQSEQFAHNNATRLADDNVRRLSSAWAQVRTEVRSGMLHMQAMCSMRMLAMAGPALQRNNAAGYNCTYLGIDNPYAFVELLVLLMCGCGCGFSVEREFTDRLPPVRSDYPVDNTWDLSLPPRVLRRDDLMIWHRDGMPHHSAT